MNRFLRAAVWTVLLFALSFAFVIAVLRNADRICSAFASEELARVFSQLRDVDIVPPWSVIAAMSLVTGILFSEWKRSTSVGNLLLIILTVLLALLTLPVSLYFASCGGIHVFTLVKILLGLIKGGVLDAAF